MRKMLNTLVGTRFVSGTGAATAYIAKGHPRYKEYEEHPTDNVILVEAIRIECIQGYAGEEAWVVVTEALINKDTLGEIWVRYAACDQFFGLRSV